MSGGRPASTRGSPPGAVQIGHVPAPPQLRAFARGAEAAGRRLVVGGLVHDGAGRLFVQRRSEDRALYPGCWDVVGGHAEAGEGVLEALRREIEEETGWRLASVGEVVEILDWEAGAEAKREIDLLVTVQGDLDAPRLERGKHTAARWLTADELPLLLERRDPDDVFIHDIVRRAFVLLGLHRDR